MTRPSRTFLIGIVAASIVLASCLSTFAQQNAPSAGQTTTQSAGLTPAKLPEIAQPDVVDNPVTFRLVQLAAVEVSLKAVDEALQKAGHKSNYLANKADEFENKNDTMNRLGGGPVPWDKFYGKTAEKFFYHPTDPNTFYLNPKPVSQRPPQFDYVYRANATQSEKAKQEVAALGGKVDKLLERKRKLESEQVALWGQISAALVAQRELGDRPLYSFHLKIDDMDADQSIGQRVTAIEAFAQYLRVLDRAADFVDRNIVNKQALALAALKQNVESARKSLVRDLAGVDSDVRFQTDSLTDIAKGLAVVTKSALETRDTALESDSAGDDSRKMSSRGMLQTAMIVFADKTASLDDGVVKLANDWKVKPLTDKPLPEVRLIEVSAEAKQPSVPPPTAPTAARDGTNDSQTANNGNSSDNGKGRITECRISRGNGNWERHPIVYVDDKPYVIRRDGTKTPAIFEGSILKWQMAGTKRFHKIDLQKKIAEDLSPVEITYEGVAK